MAGLLPYKSIVVSHNAVEAAVIQAKSLVDIAHSLSRILEELVKLNNPYMHVKLIDEEDPQ